jgi:hypothetical protein
MTKIQAQARQALGEIQQEARPIMSVNTNDHEITLRKDDDFVSCRSWVALFLADHGFIALNTADQVYTIENG